MALLSLRLVNDKLHAQTAAAEEHHQANQEAARQSIDTLARLFNEGTEGFQRRIGESVDTITERFGGLLDSLSERQAQSVKAAEQQMTQVTDSVRKRIEETVERMTAQMDALLRQLAEQQRLANTDADQRIKSLRDAFTQITGELHTTLGQVREISVTSNQSIGQLTTLVEGLTAAMSEMERLSGPVITAAEKFEKTGNQLVGLIESVRTSAENLSESAEQLHQSTQQTRDAWMDYQQRFEDIDKALGQAFTDLANGVQA